MHSNVRDDGQILFESPMYMIQPAKKKMPTKTAISRTCVKNIAQNLTWLLGTQLSTSLLFHGVRIYLTYTPKWRKCKLQKKNFATDQTMSIGRKLSDWSAADGFWDCSSPWKHLRHNVHIISVDRYRETDRQTDRQRSRQTREITSTKQKKTSVHNIAYTLSQQTSCV